MSETSRISTTHVGSLVRPPELLPFVRAIERNEPYDHAAYERCLRDAVHEVVRRQVEAGVEIVSDGEFGKSISWSLYVLERLGGLEFRPFPGDQRPASTTDRLRFPEFYEEYDAHQEYYRPGQIVCTGPLTYVGQAQLQRDIDNLKTAADAAGARRAFLPVAAPTSAFPTWLDEHYGSDDKFLYAVADALRVEYEAILAAGFDLQVDDAFLPHMFERLEPTGTTPAQYRELMAPRIDVLNHALRGLPAERIRYHLCWGSWNGPHTGDIPLAEIIELVLRVNTGTYLFEAANPRHEHEWKVWRDVDLPADRKLAPGLVSHATNVVEHPELIADRLERFATIVGPERLLASTDCGFAQSPFISRVHPSIVWAKLRALADGAQVFAGRAL